MAHKIAISTLNASTIDIINTIRANASAEYQSLVPVVETAHDIPAVGQVLVGYPAMANQFLSGLINRVAAVWIKSAVFNNAYAMLKKGYLEFGEIVTEYFVQIAKAREFSAEKAEQRELKRSLPDVRAAFHIMNYKVQYPVTIQDQDLRQAFTSEAGVQDLIARIVDSVYTAAEYDEFLLFKYLLIKAISSGKMKPVAFDATDMKKGAVAFRGSSNALTFVSTKYNAAGVHTATPKADQVIFMDSAFNAAYDVDVLSAAFNMDKADFMGRLMLIDDFTSFDNERFDVIRANSDMIEEVTDSELALMADVKAVLLDTEWFQIYDNNVMFTEKYVASGMYWNYFYNVWKTVSSSPFSNAIVFVDDGATVTAPASFTFTVSDKSADSTSTVLSLTPTEATSLQDQTYNFIQTEDATQAGIAIHKYGAVIIPAADTDGVVLSIESNGKTYTASAALKNTAAVGDTLTFSPANF